MIPFHGNIIFSELVGMQKERKKEERNVRKQHLPTNAYSCVNMKLLYTIAERKDETFYDVLLRKQAIFRWRLGQFFIDDI